MTPTLLGADIILRSLKIIDAPAIQKYFPHWDIVKNLSTRIPWPYPEDGAFQFLSELILPKIISGEMYGWAICEKETPDDLIGTISYCSTEPRELQRGFWLAQEFQGRGYMTQAVCLMQDFLFLECSILELYFMNAVENIGSSRIKEKTGATYVGPITFEHLSGGTDSELWKLTREDWIRFRTSI